jgi:galactose mutarotase-like enzyme
MSTITIQASPYKTYILEDPSIGLKLEVVPERGGIVTQWQVQNQEVFYLDHQRFQDPNLSVRGGIPILFPICGNLPDDSYQFNSQTYHLKQHGFARTLPWTVTAEHTTDFLGLSIKLTSNDETLKVYPFEFAVEFTYKVTANSLEIQQRVTNHSQDTSLTMPFSVGFHPYFAVQDKSQLEIDIPADQWIDKETGQPQPFSGEFDFDQEEIDLALGPVTRPSATVKDRGQSRQVTMEYDQPFTTVVFWTVKGKDFYCLEPWSGPRNALNTGKDLQQLAPGSSWETWVRFKVDAL